MLFMLSSLTPAGGHFDPRVLELARDIATRLFEPTFDDESATWTFSGQMPQGELHVWSAAVDLAGGDALPPVDGAGR